MKYTKEFKLRCIKIGECSIGDTAKDKNVPKQTISRWIKLHRELGHQGLENKTPGVKKKLISPENEEKVLNLWAERKRSAYKMFRDLSKKRSIPGRDKNNHSNVSKREVYEIYKKHHLNYKEIY